MVQDGGSPPKQETQILTIDVLRNLYAPVFVNASYALSLLETQATGQTVLTILATDADLKVRYHPLCVTSVKPISHWLAI